MQGRWLEEKGCRNGTGKGQAMNYPVNLDTTWYRKGPRKDEMWCRRMGLMDWLHEFSGAARDEVIDNLSFRYAIFCWLLVCVAQQSLGTLLRFRDSYRIAELRDQ